MGIIPGAVVQAKYDRARSYFERKRTWPLLAGSFPPEEGMLLHKVASGSVVEAAVTAGVADEVPLGVALLSFISGSTFTKHQVGKVPTIVPPTFRLAKQQLVDVGAGLPEAYGEIAGTPIVWVASPAVPAAPQVAIDVATGILTFDPADAGKNFWVNYKYNLTVAEAQELFRDSHVNRGADPQFNSCSVGMGKCRIYTSNYDGRGQWELLTQNGAGNSPCLGADGQWTTVSLNATGTPFGRVISLPTVDDPFLGIDFNTPA